MARVIQDSDDELDDNLEVDVHQPEKKDASPKQSNSDASSTEALQRQIEAAHRAHLQSQFPMNDDQTLCTLEVNHQKRKGPADFDSNGVLNENFAPKRTPVTYGRNSNGIFCSSPADQQHNQSLLDQVNLAAGTTNGTDWMLEGTMREAYAQHNPNAMFPEPSSTVPNATLTQQRVMEGLLAPALLGSDVDNGRTLFQPDASIPWSEYLKSPTSSGEQPRSSAQEPRATQNVSAVTSDPSPNEYCAPSRSQRSRQESLMLVGSSSTQNVSPDMLDAQDIIVFLSDEAQSKARQPHATSCSTVNGSARGKTPSSSRQSRKKRPRPSPGPTSDDDLADLGLPKEQYKPRPGRSRSLKAGTQESVDYSVRLEKATKASRRRKSTPATTSLAKPPSTPDRIRQICKMGFTPSTSASALKQNKGDVTQTIDWLITNRVADDELASHASQMSRTGNDQLTANIHEHNGELQGSHIGAKQTVATNIGATSDAVNSNTASAETDIVAFMVELRSPAKVQVLIPAKSPMDAVETSVAPATSHKKAKRRKTTLDQPEPTAADTTVKEAKVEKKRGRGRSKKATKASASTEIVQDDEDEGPKEQARGSPLLSVDGNAQPPSVQQQVVEDTATSIPTKPNQCPKIPQPGGATTVAATTRSMSEPPELPDRPEIEPITPERVKKPAPREQPSNNKGKVLYRVGLSKRARIAPLLRTMKK